MDEKNEELQYQITKDFGELNIRPMFKIDLWSRNDAICSTNWKKS
jgi:hypothetical protein